MSGKQSAQVILRQQKNLADPSQILFPDSTRQPFVDCYEVYLTGYVISGNMGTLPDHLLLKFTGVAGHQLTRVTDGNGDQTFLESDGHFVLYPPGGVSTQGRTLASIKFNDQSVNLEGKRMSLLAPTAGGGYTEFKDYTSVLIELQLVAHNTRQPRNRAEILGINRDVSWKEVLDYLRAGISPDAGIDFPRAP